MASWETQTTASTHEAQASLNAQVKGRNRDSVSMFDGLSGVDFGGYQQQSNTLGGMGAGLAISNTLFPANPFASAAGIAIGGGIGSTQITGYDMVGIVGSQVGPMRDSIAVYVSKIQKYVEEAIEKADAGMNSAFRGVDAQREVKAYLEKVKLYITNLISQLISFSDKLADVGNAWIKAQENIGSSVNASTGAFSEGTAYTESVTYQGTGTSTGITGGSGGHYTI